MFVFCICFFIIPEYIFNRCIYVLIFYDYAINCLLLWHKIHRGVRATAVSTQCLVCICELCALCQFV